MQEFLLSLNASRRAKTLVQSAFVWDNHVCLPLRKDDDTFLPRLKQLKHAGYNAVTVNIGYDLMSWHNTVQVLANMRHFIKNHGDDYCLIERAEDFDKAQESGRLGVLFDIEGGLALGDHLPMVQLYYDLGVRWMLLAYNKTNSLAGGCQDPEHGLTPYGRQVVTEMERVGMMVCCSHTSENAALEVMEMATKPVIFSHSNVKRLHDHARNISDLAIDRCAQTGGVVGVTGVSLFLNAENQASSESIAEHIDYLVQRIGSEHVGISSDFTFDTEEMMDWVKNHPDVFDPNQFSTGIDIMTPSQLVEIADCLLQNNYPEQAVRGILGQNFLRVAQQVWR